MLAVFTVILGSLYPLGSIVQGKIADHVGCARRRPERAVLMLARADRDPLLRPGITAAIDSPVD